MTDQQRRIEGIADDDNPFELLEWTNARLAQCLSVLFRETEKHLLEESTRRFLEVLEMHRQIKRVAVRVLTMLPSAIRVRYDPEGGSALEDIVEVLGSFHPAELDGFNAETCKFVKGPPSASKRYVYDFTDRRGYSIRIALPRAIDDLWHGEGGGGQRKETSE